MNRIDHSGKIDGSDCFDNAITWAARRRTRFPVARGRRNFGKTGKCGKRVDVCRDGEMCWGFGELVAGWKRSGACRVLGNELTHWIVARSPSLWHVSPDRATRTTAGLLCTEPAALGDLRSEECGVGRPAHNSLDARLVERAKTTVTGKVSRRVHPGGSVARKVPPGQARRLALVVFVSKRNCHGTVV